MDNPFLAVIGFCILLCLVLFVLWIVGTIVGAAASWAYGVACGLLNRPLGRRWEPVSHRPARPQIPSQVRHYVLQRDGYQCVECGATENLEMDHEVPLSRGGASTPENLRVLCHLCNTRKGTY